GQLVSKDVGGDAALQAEQSTGLQTIDYSYNIRGWLKTINYDTEADNDLFNFKIAYNNPTTPGATPLYNGNISETFWKTANDNNERGYDYTYDALNRIKAANYHGYYELTEAPSAIENYTVSGINYDKNGNILSLKRYGYYELEGVKGIDIIDHLTYAYTPLSNQLKNVTDNAYIEGFKDGNNGNTLSQDYEYDINGNMTTDRNKGITSIAYNHINLPTRVVFENLDPQYSTTWKAITYTYDATGVKLQKTVQQGSIGSYSTTHTKYATHYIYVEDATGETLTFFNHPEGYVEPNTGNGYDYVYQYKDHLGNIRLSYKDNNGSLEIVEENNYYPFGLEHKGYGAPTVSEHPYKYNGKELNKELGLDWYDYGARNYDAAIGRWMNLDNLAEQYKTSSPYHYAGNIPILYYDIDGNEITGTAWKWVNKLIADMDSRIDYYHNSIAKTKQKLKDGKISQKTADRRLNRLSSNKSDLNEKFDVVRGEIATLEASDQVYDVVGDSGGTERDLLGNSTTTNTTSFNFSNGNVEITASSGTDLSLFAHELKHAYQFEIGEISFGRKRADFTFGIDKYDELAGKQRGALFGGSNINSIQDLGSQYDGLPDGPYNSNSVKWIRQALQYQTAEEQQKRLKQVATSFRHAFRVNGKTYYKKKE